MNDDENGLDDATGVDEAGADDASLNLKPDERKLVTQPYDLGVKGINRDIENKQIVLNVEYQRRYVWDTGKASRFIESLLLNVPIPVVYFAEDADGNYEVIDGLQRLTTIRNFLSNQFALSQLPVLKELSGKLFEELDPREQRRLENRTIRCIVITEDSNPDIKFDVFERLNTGSAQLTAQELRNSVHRGPLNDHLKRLAELESFTRLVPGVKNRRMDLEETVLRFLAFSYSEDAYKPPLRQFLNGFMRDNRHKSLTPEQVELFDQSCKLVGDVLGAYPFKAPGSPNALNKAIFDAVMISFAFADREAIRQKKDEVRSTFQTVYDDAEFLRSIGKATADRTRVSYRIALVCKKLNELGIETSLPHSLGAVVGDPIMSDASLDIVRTGHGEPEVK